MEKRNTLGLYTPERNAAPVGSFLTNPQDIEAWVDSLPMANVGETARQIFKTIVEFNRLEMPHLNRLKIVEKFRQPIRYISKNLEKHYFDTPLPLSTKSRKIAILNRELYSELTTAYKIFIEQMISGSHESFDQRKLIVAIHRVMHYQLRVIYYSVIIYDPIPNGTWKEIHRLYTYAELNDIHNLLVKAGKDGEHSSTITDLYKQILLFSLCSPFRLRQREIKLIYTALPEWSSDVSIGLPDPDKKRDCHFISRLWSDAPPSHVALQTKEASKRSRELSTSKLVLALQKQAAKLPSESSSEHGCFSRHLLQKVQQALTNAPKRQYVRTKLNFELKTAVGLSDIHTLINVLPATVPVEQTLTPTEKHRAVELDWLTGTGKNAELRSGIFNLNNSTVAPNSQNVFFNEEAPLSEASGIENCHDGAIPAWASSAHCLEAKTFTCKTINESAGGYCIQWSGPNAPKLKIGEVVGIQSASNQNQFGVGISRWIKNSPGQGLLLGMEVIAASCLAVDLHPAANHAAPENKKKGLLIPASSESKQHTSLIVPTLLFKPNDILTITDGTRKEQIRLTKLLESTGAFAHFEFDSLNGKKHMVAEDDAVQKENFDNIWSHI